MERLYKVCGVVFMLALGLPAVQRMTKVFPSAALDGVESKMARPRLTLRSWWSGEYQRQREAYDNERVGFRGPLVRTYNQIQFSLFEKVAGRRGTQLVVGRDGWLYEWEYVRYYVWPGRCPERKLEPLVAGLRRLQDALDRRGVVLVVAISPSKPEIYPEHLPVRIQSQPRRAETETDYARMIGLFERYGIRRVDGHALFKTWKSAAAYPLFPPVGVHWNQYGAFLMTRQILDTVRTISGKPVPAPECAAVEWRLPEGSDLDLGRLLNVWRCRGAGVPVPYPRYAAPLAGTYRPSLLLVGDSFSFTLIDVLRGAGICRDCHLLYYYKRLYTYAEGDPQKDHARVPNRPARGEQIDWDQVVFGKDAIILEINEVTVAQLGWGFIDDALRRVERATDRP